MAGCPKFSPRLHSPQGPEGVLKLEHVDCRGEEGGLRPLHRQRTPRRLCGSGVLGHPLPLVDFGATAAGGGGQDRGQRKRNDGEQGRSLEKKREAWRRGLFTERGRGAVFKLSTPHDHGVGRGRFTRPLSSVRLPRVFHAPGVANGGGGKPGRRWLGRRVGPGSLRLPYLDWPSGAAEPQP